MSRLIVLFKNEIRLLLRDKRSFILLFLMPALLVLTLSTILNHLYSNQKPNLKILIVSEKKTIVGEQLAAALEKTQESVSFLEAVPENAHKNHDVLIKIPLELPQLLRMTPTESSSKVEFIFYKFMDPFQKSFLMNEFVRLLQAEIIKEINAEISLQGNGPSSGIIDPSLLVVETKGTGSRDFPPLNFSLAAWSLFAIFFIVIPFSNSIYRDWNNDILLKFKSLHLSKALVLGSRIIAYLLINFLQFFFLLFLGLVVFPAILGSGITFYPSSLYALSLVVLASSLAASAFALFVSCICRTQEQASSLGAFGVVLMSLLGGTMIPTIFMPQFMSQFISVISPLYWGLEGFAEAFQQNPDMHLLMRSIFVLLFFAFSFYVLALSSFKWEKR